MTDYQKQVLQWAIKEHFFAPSDTQLAKEMKITGKMLFSRFLDNATRPETNDKLWDQIAHTYNMSDVEITYLLEIWQLSDLMTEQLNVDAFLPLVQRKRVSLSEEVRTRLRALYKEDPLIYGYALALFYTKVRGYNPNDKKEKSFVEIIQQVDALLQPIYPDQLAAHKVALDSIQTAQDLKLYGWCNLMLQLGRIICYYTHPLYLDNRIEIDFKPMPWESRSYWIDAHANETETTIWVLEQIEESGIYEVLQIHAKQGEPLKEENCTYQRWGFFREYDSIRCGEPNGKKMLHSAFYDYDLDGENMRIELELRKDLSSKSPIVLPLQMVDIHSHSVWYQWLQEQDKDEIDVIFYQKSIHAIGFEDTDQEVVDVIMSRNSCVLMVKQEGKGLSQYTIKLDKYPSVKQISVWDDVDIFRGIGDGKLYAYWSDSGLCVEIDR